MDHKENDFNMSPTATYQLFVKRNQIRQQSTKKLLPLFGCKINLHTPRLNNPINLQLNSKKNISGLSYSVNQETQRYIPNKDSQYQLYINEIIKKKQTQTKFYNINTNNNNNNKNQDSPLNKTLKSPYNLLLPQLYVPPKIKYKKNKILNTEPAFIEELQPWESSQKSIAFF